MLLLLLFAMPEISIEFIKWAIGVSLTIALYIHKLYLDRLKAEADKAAKERDAHKKEIDDMCERLEKVEEVDKTAYPAFTALLTEFKLLKELVTITQANQIHNAKHDLDLMRVDNERRFLFHENMISDVKKAVDDVKSLIRENQKENRDDTKMIMEELLKLRNPQLVQSAKKVN